MEIKAALAKPSNTEEEKEAKKKALAAAQGRYITLVMSAAQCTLAASLLGYVTLKPRTQGVLGALASVLSVYQLTPAVPKAKAA
jgi:hypothetical protein